MKGDSKLDPKAELRQQLLEMEFEPELFEKALETANNLEQAIQTVISMLEAQEQFKETDEMQLVVVVRMDLKMGQGKVSAQCAHAILRAFKNGRACAEEKAEYAIAYIEWLEKGKQQVFYRVRD